ncbi:MULTISPECIES: GntP family permease [Brucella/Ochrobactrum group]|jgi:gluconate:H+ symporter, GntP family|uniref:Gluconate transporter n=3 Tax=Brucella TaxID=234 RepID=A6X6W7_BRUA4|nr:MULTISPECIES: gluconate:H+ symporter [Brucella/Ochrobactrum group]MCR5942427.1 GntP family permease [Ochrobactrum sp. XJ1]QOD66157.1 GntP family permease [Ochrobactrum sp. MT180101]QTN04265.1 GntP family permease [Ochrobactrum sp. EEELCW01]RNL42804.1 GntP family permease [Ochrobactrum sp. MH181795]ABS16971.1 gluconate transporter [Brucella anthropi ATCC 49188]
MQEFQQTMGAGALISIAVGAVLLLLLLIIRFRVHAFVALIIVSLLTALATGIPAGNILTTITSAFGSTLGGVALLVGLGAMLGRLLEISGGAQALADDLIRRFGEKRAPMALGIASLIFGFPIFFDAGLVVMLPVVFTVARRLKGSLLLYGIPVAAAFSVMHVFVPPHPGPVAASELLGADVGLLILVGIVVVIPVWFIAGHLFGAWIGKKIVLPIPDSFDAGKNGEEAVNPPSSGLVMLLLLLPLVLIFINTGLDFARAQGWVSADANWYQLARMIGSTPVALLISVLVASYVLGPRRGRDAASVERILDSALGPVCSIILITGAGGMFGGVLRASGIGDALSNAFADTGLPVIVAGFLIATILRVAQGSATVALITAAGLIQPAVQAAGYHGLETAAVVIALAAGSVMLSHVNDSGFWLVGRFFNMDVKTTLKTWTVLETLIGLLGFGMACILFWLA